MSQAGAHEAKLCMKHPTGWIEVNQFVYFNAIFLRKKARPLRISAKFGVATELRTV
jgi:hypothetical protein